MIDKIKVILDKIKVKLGKIKSKIKSKFDKWIDDYKTERM